MKKLVVTLMILVIVMTFVLKPMEKEVDAASNYISVQSFSKLLVEKLELISETLDTNSEINILIEKGIIKEGDFTDYTANLTRGDMLLLLSRADDYLNKTKIKSDLVKEVIDKRISDIDKVDAIKQEDVAKGYIKGLLKGYSNGKYSSDRELKVKSKVTKAGAKECLKLLIDKSKRAKLSPDGQLLRTTKLPNNANMFKYILDSYPNRYYEGKMSFEGVTMRVNGVLTPLKSPEDYTYPKNIAKAKVTGIDDFNQTMEKYEDLWMDRVYTRVWNTFNVNYKTIDDNWVETMAQTDSFIYNNSESLYKFLNKYVDEMKNNKTIVKCSKVALDSSSMYYYNGFYYIRCYVRYKIVSTKTKISYTSDELDNGLWGPYNCVLFSRSGYTDLTGYKLNKWTEGVFDVGICTGIYGNTGSAFGVVDCDWSPDMFRSIERN